MPELLRNCVRRGGGNHLPLRRTGASRDDLRRIGEFVKTIKQKSHNDCGVACVAMLAGVSYKEARRVVYPTGRARLTSTKVLHAALRELGRDPAADRRTRFGSTMLHNLKNDALVFVELTDGDGGKLRHWVVWDAEAQKIRDPDTASQHRHLRGYLLMK